MSVAHPRTPLETVIDALAARAARGCKPRGNDQGWASRCPAHDDHNPSLSISKGDQGVVLHCHAGCTPEAVVAAIGLNLTDLFDRTNGHKRQIQDTYNYTDPDGNLLFQTVRYVPKDFRQRRPDGHGGWLWNLQGVQRVLYRLPEVLAAVQARQRIWVVEGEKDADALVKAGAVATCNPMGADSGTGNKWLSNHTATLAGADVVVVADKDDQGRRHARYVATQLEAVGCTIHLVEAMSGKDAATHLAAGHQLAEFVLTNPDKPWDEPDDQADTEIEPERDPTSWKPVDLTDALTGNDIEPPELWHRSDNVPLIYMGRVHWFQGESESCKSWAAQIVVAAQLAAGQHVLYIDYEDDDRGVVARLLALGTAPDAIAAYLTYIRPDEALRDRHGRYTDAWLDLVDVLDTRTYTLCVIDGVTEAMTTEGLELISNTDIAAWMRLIPKRISSTGAAVVCIDHVTKSTETQGRYAIGGQHKLAGVTGAAYRFTALRPLARATGTEPVTGTVAVTVMKDRPGYVRGRSPEGKVGTLSITAYPDGGITAALDPHGQGPVLADMKIAGRILTHLSTYDGLSKTKVEQEVEGNVPQIRETLTWLVARGWVRVEQKGQSHLHWLTEEGRSEVPET